MSPTKSCFFTSQGIFSGSWQFSDGRHRSVISWKICFRAGLRAPKFPACMYRLYSHYRVCMYETYRDLMMILGKMWFEISLLHWTPRSVDIWMTSSGESSGNYLCIDLTYHINQCKQQMQCECMPLIGCLLPWSKTLPPVVYCVCISPKDVALKGISFPNRLEFKKLKGSTIKVN